MRAIVRMSGGGKKTATFDTRAEAEQWAARMEQKKSVGQLRGDEGGRVTNAELFEAYDDAVGSKTDSAKWNRLRIMKWCRDPLGAKKLIDTRTHDINEWVARAMSTPNKRTGQKLSPATVNRELNLMSAVFSYAVKDRQWIDVNPCHGARRPPQGRPRKRPLLTEDQIEAVLIATGYSSDPDLTTLTARVGACFLLALETGMRSGEILRVRPQDYWRDRRTVHVAAISAGGRKGAKSGRVNRDPSRNVPLTEKAIELFDQLLRTMPADQEPFDRFDSPPYLVGMNDAKRDALWRRCRDRAGLDDVHFHDMKHEAATRLARYIDVLALSHAIGTKDVRLLRDTYYTNDASTAAALLPAGLTPRRAA